MGKKRRAVRSRYITDKQMFDMRLEVAKRDLGHFFVIDNDDAPSHLDFEDAQQRLPTALKDMARDPLKYYAVRESTTLLSYEERTHYNFTVYRMDYGFLTGFRRKCFVASRHARVPAALFQVFIDVVDRTDFPIHRPKPVRRVAIS